MFTAILGKDIVKEIRSDKLISTQAIKSYDKIKGNFRPKIFNTISKKYFEFSKKILLSDDDFVVSITEDGKKQRLQEYYDRMDRVHPLGLTVIEEKEYRTRNKNCDLILYGGDIVEL